MSETNNEVFVDPSEESKNPPEHLFGDYIEIIYLFCVIIIGIPLNIRIFINLMMQLRQMPKNNVKVGYASFSHFVFFSEVSF